MPYVEILICCIVNTFIPCVLLLNLSTTGLLKAFYKSSANCPPELALRLEAALKALSFFFPRFQVQWSLLFQLPPANFDASWLFLTDTLAKTTAFFEGFGVKTTGRDWFWMVLV